LFETKSVAVLPVITSDGSGTRNLGFLRQVEQGFFFIFGLNFWLICRQVEHRQKALRNFEKSSNMLKNGQKMKKSLVQRALNLFFG